MKMKKGLQPKVSHYNWLDKHLPAFLAKVGIDFNICPGIVSAHGDKCYGYRHRWEEAGIEFPHGVAIFLLSYLSPFDDETRETKDGWVDVCEWVIKNKDRFAPYLPPIDPNVPDILSPF